MNEPGRGVARDWTIEDMTGTDPVVVERVQALGAAREAGRLIHSFRAAAHLSQAELGRRLDVSQARISTLERGASEGGPTYALMKRIAVACGIDWPGRVALPVVPHVASPKARGRATLSPYAFGVARNAARRIRRFAGSVLGSVRETEGEIVMEIDRKVVRFDKAELRRVVADADSGCRIRMEIRKTDDAELRAVVEENGGFRSPES